MYVYCVVCYRPIAASCVRSVDCLCNDDSECSWTMTCLYYPKYFSLVAQLSNVMMNISFYMKI